MSKPRNFRSFTSALPSAVWISVLALTPDSLDNGGTGEGNRNNGTHYIRLKAYVKPLPIILYSHHVNSELLAQITKSLCIIESLNNSFKMSPQKIVLPYSKVSFTPSASSLKYTAF